MRLTISFKHFEHTPALDEIIRQKSQKLEKFLGGVTSVQWVCYVSEGKHYAEVQLHGPNFNFHAKSYTDIMYKTVDKVLAKIEKQIYKQKEKWKRNRSSEHPPLNADPEVVWGDHDEDKFDDVA